MENRVQKYKLDAKKAYEFAGGFREVIPGRDKTRRIYGNKAGRPSYSGKRTELSTEEKEVFISPRQLEYGYRYAVKLFNCRFETAIEDKFLSVAETPDDVKYAIEYCKHFGILVPTNLHNRILMQTAVPVDKAGMRWSERYAIEKSERKQKRYLQKLQEHKKSFKMVLESVLKENNLGENNTIKDLFDAIN